LKNLNPNVSVDCVVFGFDNERLNVLLIEQKLNKRDRVQCALPGDLITDDESLDDAASRVLKELTDLEGIYLQQLKAFGDPNRVRDVKDLDWLESYREAPGARVITVAYLSLIKMEGFKPEASSFAGRVFWSGIDDIPALAFDHNQIIDEALQRLRKDFENNNTGFELLPENFTLSQIQSLYEILLGRKLDKRNFRKKLIKDNIVTPTGKKQKGVLHKPAQLYEISKDLDK
jgi:8-oxo-dGTP diphosphatase